VSERGTARRRPLRLARVVVLAMIAALLVGLGAGDTPGARAAFAADFDAGNIISDSTFFNSGAMSADQIQAFLTSRGGSCDSAARPCLKSYTTTTTAKAADGLCRGYAGGVVQSAAQIIAGVAWSCGVNPQVLLVLLEKEQRLVTRSDPSATQYTKAVGYACPDTPSGCDPAYAGLFNQLYNAARRFQDYAARPDSFRHKAGQWNSVLWNVEGTGCGAGSVFIANQATAGLYNYTPYQPNAAAMANLYGTGDACSAYGNRNFWRMFSDWFGNPQAGGGYLMRTPENATVYVVSGSSKYAIADMATLGALAPLGPVGYVSQQYLDRRTTVSLMSRVVLAPDGTVYFIDAGIRLPFASCAQVADYGASCASLVRLEQSLIDAFHPGPAITPIYRTTSGKTFYVSGGVKREVVDELAQAAAGLPTAAVRLMETGLSYLPYGAPVIRDGVVLRNRSSRALAVAAGGQLTTVSDVVAATALSGVPVRELDEASMRLLPAAVPAPGVFVREAGGPRVFLLTEAGKRVVDAAVMVPASVPEMPVAVLALMPDAPAVAAGTFVKGSANGTVFAVNSGVLRGIGAWGDLVALNGGNVAPQILTVDQRIVDALPRGPLQRRPGTMVVSPGNATVFLVDGYDELIPVGSFAVTAELGATSLVSVPAADLAPYTVRPGSITPVLECEGVRYLGLGGKLYRIGADAAAHYPVPAVTTVAPSTCAALPSGGDLSRFLWAKNGTIFYVENGVKRPITSWQTYLNLGGGSAPLIAASDWSLSLVPTGPVISAASQAAPATAPAAAGGTGTLPGETATTSGATEDGGSSDEEVSDPGDPQPTGSASDTPTPTP
jgi:hypothetical protein